jgi:hypothetical protein
MPLKSWTIATGFLPWMYGAISSRARMISACASLYVIRSITIARLAGLAEAVDLLLLRRFDQDLGLRRRQAHRADQRILAEPQQIFGEVVGALVLDALGPAAALLARMAQQRQPPRLGPELLARLDHLLGRHRLEQVQLLLGDDVGIVRALDVIQRLLQLAAHAGTAGNSLPQRTFGSWAIERSPGDQRQRLHA